MKTKLRPFFLIIAAGIILVGCSDKGVTPIVRPEMSHTLIMYMLGNNNLASDMQANIKAAMEGVGYTFPDNSQVIVYDVTPSGGATLYKITRPASSREAATLTLIKEYGYHNSIDPQIMQQVLGEIKTMYPSDSYGIVLSSHGTGWFPSSMRDPASPASAGGGYSGAVEHDFSKPDDAMTKWFGQDGSSLMSIEDLSDGLSVIGLEYIIFDACFMSSVEALYELRDNADYIMASPVEILVKGMPFNKIVPLIFSDNTIEERLGAAGQSFVNYYRSGEAYSQDMYKSAAITLIKTSELNALAAAVKGIYSSPLKEVDLSGVQYLELMTNHAFFDLRDYLRQANNDSNYYNQFTQAIDKLIVFEDHTAMIYTAYTYSNFSAVNFHGISTYVTRDQFPVTKAAWLQTEWAKAIEAQ